MIPRELSTHAPWVQTMTASPTGFELTPTAVTAGHVFLFVMFSSLQFPLLISASSLVSNVVLSLGSVFGSVHVDIPSLVFSSSHKALLFFWLVYMYTHAHIDIHTFSLFTFKVLPDLNSKTSLILTFYLFLFHWNYLASMFLHEDNKHMSASGPLHLVSPLTESSFPE